MRTKEHPANPMTVDDALYEMELVGHDFFLFHDKQSDKPCVVYRRHAYDYGLDSARLSRRLDSPGLTSSTGQFDESPTMDLV